MPAHLGVLLGRVDEIRSAHARKRNLVTLLDEARLDAAQAEAS